MIDHLRGREKVLEAFGWTGRSAIAAHVATWRSDAAAHGHAPSPDAGAMSEDWVPPTSGATRAHRLPRHPWLVPLQ